MRIREVGLTALSLLLSSLDAAAAAPLALPPASARAVEFAADIQPLFAASCYQCHGSKRQEGGLRLDERTAALKGGDHGPVILPGDSAGSLLVQLLAGVHAELPRMPRKGDPLSAEQIGLVRAWIDRGASWPANATATTSVPKHWAFVSPTRPLVPAVRNRKWPANDIDRFVLARLEKEGIEPSPAADRTTLLRRLTLDLTGLPPTPEEIDAFLADKSTGAWSRQVERLLKSPHYGERWGRHWLDAARYADSDGFEKDKPRWVWFYRDWVIESLNRDLPYNEFVIQQIAGDLLPGADQAARVATGFLRNSMLNEEGGIDPEQFRMEAMFDRMDAIGKSVLGLTIQCAQCHNHKYDPLSQEEYYRLFAFLNNSHEANVVVYSSDEQIKRANLLRRIAEIEADLRHRHPDWQDRLARWEDSVRTTTTDWKPLDLENAGDNGQPYAKLADLSIVASGYAPTKFTASFTNTVHDTEIRSFRLEALTEPNLPARGPGRSIKGLFGLTEFKVEAQDATNPTNKIQVRFTLASADFANDDLPLDPIYDDKSGKSRITGPVHYAIDDKDETAWGIDAGPGRRNVPRQAVFVAATNIAFPNGTKLTIHLRQMHGGWNSDDNQNMNLGRFRVSLSADPDATADPLGAAARAALLVPRAQRTDAHIHALFSAFRRTVPEWKEANATIEALWKEHPEGTTQLVLDERQQSRPTHVLRRGDWLKPSREVAPGTPAFLHALEPSQDPPRLAFARWLADPRSPTTARAFVNRVWQQYFGTGLVETSEDLGVQAAAPSHPELLDWLAVEFMDQGWSLKQLHRLIAHSSTYRQSSRVTPDAHTRDPYNRLLARGPRLRVEAEIIRDISLAASGLLNPHIGGPSVYPPAPAFLFSPPASYGPKIWQENTGPDRYRRALYTFRYRSVPYPVLQTFDAPNGDFSCVRRPRSNTPLQALTTLNEDLFIEAARALALKTLEHGGSSDSSRLTYAFRRCVGRVPTRAESRELLALLERQSHYIGAGWVDARDLGFQDPDKPSPLPKDATPAQLAAWTTVARVLLNLDETITKE